MLNEIKKKRTKFGTVIVLPHAPVASPSTLAASAAHTYIHHVGESRDEGSGVRWVGHKQLPSLKAVIGHFISNFQSDGLVAFVQPDVTILSSAEAVYARADALRLERTFAIFAGPAESPKLLAIPPHLIEHLYHAIPDKQLADSGSLSAIDSWARKSLFGNRYLDANSMIAISWPEATPAPVPAPEPVVEEKRKPGRPRAKK